MGKLMEWIPGDYILFILIPVAINLCLRCQDSQSRYFKELNYNQLTMSIKQPNDGL